MTQTLWATSALLPTGWADSVEVKIDPSGDIQSIASQQPYSGGDKVGVLIPAIANVHSHAHQRAMSGLGERAKFSNDGTTTGDGFWSWRKVMYHYLEHIQPHDMLHIASQLYVEMLKSGYSCVGEFQYLHHDIGGKHYQNPAEMSLQTLHAAELVGIGFTALPVLYRYSGFGSADHTAGQKRFINTADEFIQIVKILQQSCAGNANNSVGIAPHSLRAVDLDLLNSVFTGLDDLAAIHIHIGEQQKEVDDCIAWSGARPVEWLFNHFDVDQQWCLVHATHMTDLETSTMAKSGCVAAICPTTEANLGDGFFNAVDYFKQHGAWAIGSDSHISISPVEELRWLEYGQRMLHRDRNLLTSPAFANSGRSLLEGCLAGGATAMGRKIGSIEIGYRADLLVLNDQHPRLFNRQGDDIIDSWIFSGNDNLVRDVYVGGVKVIDQGQHAQQEAISKNYNQTIARLSAL